jgi:mono/diheme cytochrome c family protein
MTLEELVAAAVKATGMSEAMVQRSAAARAKAQGSTIEAVLAEWAGVPMPAAAGGDAPAAAAKPVAAPEPADPAEAAAAPEPADPAEAAAAPAAAEPATAAPAATAEAATPEEVPAPAPAGLEVEESGEEAPIAPRHAPEPEPVVLREVVPAGAIPRWLAAMFVAVPLFALAYIGFLPNGPGCGDAGRLAVDPVSGEMVNCDGSAIGDEGEIDYFALGQEMYAANGCIVCHGAGGDGSANFPRFTGGALLTTFPEGQCPTHVEWVRLGTNQWPDPTYGANNKPVGGSGAVMPTFGTQLSDDELKAVALYERVAFGGQELAAAQLDCVGPPTEEPPAEG